MSATSSFKSIDCYKPYTSDELIDDSNIKTNAVQKLKNFFMLTSL